LDTINEISNGSTLTVLLVFFLYIMGIYLDVVVALSSLPLDQSLFDGLADSIEYLADVVVILG